METFVLIPEQLSLEEKKDSIRVVSNVSVPRGFQFSPFQGTLRTDEKLTTDSIGGNRNKGLDLRAGKGDKYYYWAGIRTASWSRFIRTSPNLCPEVNLLEVFLGAGQIVYEVRRPIEIGDELVVYSSPEPPISLAKALKEAIFEQTMRALMIEVPLDLSKQSSLFHKVPNSSDGDEYSDGSSTSPPLLSVSGPKPKRSRSLLPCSVCSKAFDRPSLLKRHMRTHTGEKPHVCDICGKGFSTSSSLNTHRRIHSGEKPHECPTCGKRFTASSNLYYHRMTHQKEKPHRCSCGKSFPTPGDLKSHGYVHSGTWPFRCPVCKRGFSKHTNLKNHLFLHTGSKPHACEICPKRFALACNLRAHLKTHHDDHADDLHHETDEIELDLQEDLHEEEEEDSNSSTAQTTLLETENETEIGVISP